MNFGQFFVKLNNTSRLLLRQLEKLKKRVTAVSWLNISLKYSKQIIQFPNTIKKARDSLRYIG